MFIVKLIGVGEGCDYTIGCNNITVTLPKSIKTMEEAVDYVTSEEEEGCLHYHGLDRIEKATIYEIVQSHEVDVAAIVRKQEEDLQKQQEDLQKDKEKKEYERLRAKFEKSGS